MSEFLQMLSDAAFFEQDERCHTWPKKGERYVSVVYKWERLFLLNCIQFLRGFLGNFVIQTSDLCREYY